MFICGNKCEQNIIGKTLDRGLPLGHSSFNSFISLRLAKIAECTFLCFFLEYHIMNTDSEKIQTKNIHSEKDALASA